MKHQQHLNCTTSCFTRGFDVCDRYRTHARSPFTCQVSFRISRAVLNHLPAEPTKNAILLPIVRKAKEPVQFV